MNSFRVFQSGELIFPEGTKGDYVYRVVQGEVGIYRYDQTTNLMSIGTINEGQLFGEMFMWEESLRRNATAIANTYCKVEILLPEEVNRFLQPLNDDKYAYIAGLISRLKSTSDELVQKTAVTEVLPEFLRQDLS